MDKSQSIGYVNNISLGHSRAFFRVSVPLELYLLALRRAGLDPDELEANPDQVARALAALLDSGLRDGMVEAAPAKQAAREAKPWVPELGG